MNYTYNRLRQLADEKQLSTHLTYCHEIIKGDSPLETREEDESNVQTDYF